MRWPIMPLLVPSERARLALEHHRRDGTAGQTQGCARAGRVSEPASRATGAARPRSTLLVHAARQSHSLIVPSHEQVATAEGS